MPPDQELQCTQQPGSQPAPSSQASPSGAPLSTTVADDVAGQVSQAPQCEMPPLSTAEAQEVARSPAASPEVRDAVSQNPPATSAPAAAPGGAPAPAPGQSSAPGTGSTPGAAPSSQPAAAAGPGAGTDQGLAGVGTFDIDFIAREYAFHEAWGRLSDIDRSQVSAHHRPAAEPAGAASPPAAAETISAEQRAQLLDSAFNRGMGFGALFGAGGVGIGVGLKLLAAQLPKAGGKLIPIVGLAMSGYDVYQTFANWNGAHWSTWHDESAPQIDRDIAKFAFLGQLFSAIGSILGLLASIAAIIAAFTSWTLIGGIGFGAVAIVLGVLSAAFAGLTAWMSSKEATLRREKVLQMEGSPEEILAEIARYESAVTTTTAGVIGSVGGLADAGNDWRQMRATARARATAPDVATPTAPPIDAPSAPAGPSAQPGDVRPISGAGTPAAAGPSPGADVAPPRASTPPPPAPAPSADVAPPRASTPPPAPAPAPSADVAPPRASTPPPAAAPAPSADVAPPQASTPPPAPAPAPSADVAPPRASTPPPAPAADVAPPRASTPAPAPSPDVVPARPPAPAAPAPAPAAAVPRTDVPAGATHWDPRTNRWLGPSGFVRGQGLPPGPAGPEGARWNPNLSRWQDTSTGRIVAGPRGPIAVDQIPVRPVGPPAQSAPPPVAAAPSQPAAPAPAQPAPAPAQQAAPAPVAQSAPAPAPSAPAPAPAAQPAPPAPASSQTPAPAAPQARTPQAPASSAPQAPAPAPTPQLRPASQAPAPSARTLPATPAPDWRHPDALPVANAGYRQLIEWLTGTDTNSLTQHWTNQRPSAPPPVFEAPAAAATSEGVVRTMPLVPAPAPPFALDQTNARLGRIADLLEREDVLQGALEDTQHVTQDVNQCVDGPIAALRARQTESEQALTNQRQQISEKEQRASSARELVAEMQAGDAQRAPDIDRFMASPEVSGAMNITSNPVVRAAINGGGAVIRAGAAVVNGVASVFGRDEPVIDTRAIRAAQDMAQRGPEVGRQRGQMSGQRSGMNEGTENAQGRTTQLEQRLQGANTQVEGLGTGIGEFCSQNEQLDTAATNLDTELAAARATDQADLQALQEQRRTETEAYNQEMGAMQLWAVQHQSVREQNRAIMAAVEVEGPREELCAEFAAQVAEQRAAISDTRFMSQQMRNGLITRAADARIAGERHNGVPYPGQFDRAAAEVIAGFERFTQGHLPVLDGMDAALTNVLPSQIPGVLRSVGHTTNAIRVTLLEQHGFAAQAIDRVYVWAPDELINLSRRPLDLQPAPPPTAPMQ